MPEDLEDLYIATNQDPESYLFGSEETGEEPLIVTLVLLTGITATRRCMESMRPASSAYVSV